MSERELLTLAAQAAGRLLPHGNPALTRPNEELRSDGGNYWFWPAGDSWNPLTDDGDALRLAVTLHMSVLSSEAASWVATGMPQIVRAAERHDGSDPYAATRRAIVRAAAEIGRAA